MGCFEAGGSILGRGSVLRLLHRRQTILRPPRQDQFETLICIKARLFKYINLGGCLVGLMLAP